MLLFYIKRTFSGATVTVNSEVHMVNLLV